MNYNQIPYFIAKIVCNQIPYRDDDDNDDDDGDDLDLCNYT